MLLSAAAGLAIFVDDADLSLEHLSTAAPMAAQQVGRLGTLLHHLAGLLAWFVVFGSAFDDVEGWLSGHWAIIAQPA